MKDCDLIHVYLVTYDIGNNDDRYKIDDFIKLYFCCKLSETTYLVAENDNFINEIHAIPITYSDKDTFVIIDLTNMEYVGHKGYGNACIKNILETNKKLFLLG